MNENEVESLIDFENDKLKEMREYLNKLGNNVIEEKRQHRISYAKTLNFRVFADVKTHNGKLILKLRKNRKENPETFTISTMEELELIKEKIKDAYVNIS